MEEENVLRTINQAEDSIEIITKTDEFILKTKSTKEGIEQKIIKKED